VKNDDHTSGKPRRGTPGEQARSSAAGRESSPDEARPGGITNRPPAREQDEQQQVPPRGRRKGRAHA